MRDIFEFNHIDQTLSEENVKFLKDLYAFYHKKHYGYEKLHRGFRRKNFVCNLSARIEYQKILEEIRFYLRGEVFDEKVFLDSLKMKDDFITDPCMEIPLSVQRKYNKKFAQL